MVRATPPLALALTLAPLSACGGERHAAAPNVVTASDPGTEVATSREETVGGVRHALVAAIDARGSSLALRVGTAETVVETPRSRAFDTLDLLMIVDVGADDDVRVAGMTVGPEGIRLPEKVLEGPRVVFFVRAEDGATMGRFFDTLETLQRAGAKHVVVGATPPSAVLARWDDCPFPPASNAAGVDSGHATVVVLVDEARRAAAVNVRASTGYGFGGAAALCIAHRSFPVGSPGADGKPFRVRFQRPSP